MAVSLEILTPSFKLTGDGVATTTDLSLLEYPFVSLPHVRPASAFVNADGGGRIASVALSGSVIALTFTSAFSGQSAAIQIGLNFELDA